MILARFGPELLLEGLWGARDRPSAQYLAVLIEDHAAATLRVQIYADILHERRLLRPSAPVTDSRAFYCRPVPPRMRRSFIVSGHLAVQVPGRIDAAPVLPERYNTVQSKQGDACGDRDAADVTVQGSARADEPGGRRGQSQLLTASSHGHKATNAGPERGEKGIG